MRKLNFKVFTLLCLTFFVCGAGSCDKMADAQWGFWVKNDSDKDVYFVLSFYEMNGKLRPSTEWPPEPVQRGYDLHLAYAKRRRQILYTARDVKFNSGDHIAIYVFDPDTLAKYTWAQLEADQNYLKKFECTNFDLAQFDLAQGLVYP